MPIALVTGVTGQDGSLPGRSVAGPGLRGARAGRCGLDPLLRRCGPRNPADRARRRSGRTRRPARAGRSEVEPDEIYNLVGMCFVGVSWQHPELPTRRSAVLGGQPARGGLAAELPGAPVLSCRPPAPRSSAPPSSRRRPRTRCDPPVALRRGRRRSPITSSAIYRVPGPDASYCVLYNHESPRRASSSSPARSPGRGPDRHGLPSR